MNKEELTEKQLAVLEEIRAIVTIGEQKLQYFSVESAKMEEKWRRKAEAKRAAAAQKQEVLIGVEKPIALFFT